MVSLRMCCTVYSITHRATGREYIGITSLPVRRRWRCHLSAANCGKPQPIARALAKHGAAAFDFRVEAEVATLKQAREAEVVAIAQRRPAFNLTAGGEGTRGWKPTAETRRRIADTKRGNVMPAEIRAKISAANRGRTLSEVTRSRMSAAFKTRTHGEGARAKMSAAHKAGLATPEARARMSEAAKRGWALRKIAVAQGLRKKRAPHSPATLEKMSASIRAALARRKAKASCP